MYHSNINYWVPVLEVRTPPPPPMKNSGYGAGLCSPCYGFNIVNYSLHFFVRSERPMFWPRPLNVLKYDPGRQERNITNNYSSRPH